MNTRIGSSFVKSELWAEQIPRPYSHPITPKNKTCACWGPRYSRAEENARELHGDFGMTTLSDLVDNRRYLPRHPVDGIGKQFVAGEVMVLHTLFLPQHKGPTFTIGLWVGR